MVVLKATTYNKLILFCFLLSISLVANAQDYEVKPIKVGKGGEQVFASASFNGKLFFCSNAKAKKAKHVLNENNSRFLNLYQINLNSDLSLNASEKARILPDNITSPLNEGPISFNSLTGDAYFSSNLASDSTAISLALYTSKYDIKTATFSDRETIEFNLGDGNYSNPSISSDGNQMVFSFTALTDTSSDLFLSKNINGIWQNPEPINELNTNYNETFPRWNGNTLYFASDRPNGIGGLDIYKSQLFENRFGESKHLPEPINSVSDDFLFFYASDKEGFLSSNRLQGKDRIFKFKLDLPSVSDFQESSINFCYTLQDEEILDKQYYDYVWEFGDGTKVNGAIVEHCYKDTGIYEVSCHLLDVETLDLEKNIINGLVEVVAKYPVIETKSLPNGGSEVYLEQKWARRNYDKYYWIYNDEIISEKTFQINNDGTKPIVIKAVLWNTNTKGDAVGITKTITLEQ